MTTQLLDILDMVLIPDVIGGKQSHNSGLSSLETLTALQLRINTLTCPQLSSTHTCPCCIWVCPIKVSKN